MKHLVAAAALLSTVAVAHAGEVFDAGGVAAGSSETSMEVIGEGHMLMLSRTTFETFEAASEGNLFAGMTGPCWGSIEVRVPSARGGGNCALTMPDGDKSFNEWTVSGMSKDGALLGTWTVIGGTGKFAGSSGGGEFTSVNDREAGTFTNTISGAITLK